MEPFAPCAPLHLAEPALQPECYITLHLPATKETTGMLNAAAFAQMKHGVRILNFARAELSSAPALAQALERPGAVRAM